MSSHDKGAIMAGMFKGPDIKTPDPKPPAPMPDDQSPAVLEAKRKAQLDIIGRAGRTSTILTAPAPANRDGAYTATRLGTAA